MFDAFWSLGGPKRACAGAPVQLPQDTKFPFPYVQLITLLLFMHAFLTPLVIAYSMDSASAIVVAVVKWRVCFD